MIGDSWCFVSCLKQMRFSLHPSWDTRYVHLKSNQHTTNRDVHMICTWMCISLLTRYTPHNDCKRYKGVSSFGTRYPLHIPVPWASNKRHFITLPLVCSLVEGKLWISCGRRPSLIWKRKKVSSLRRWSNLRDWYRLQGVVWVFTLETRLQIDMGSRVHNLDSYLVALRELRRLDTVCLVQAYHDINCITSQRSSSDGGSLPRSGPRLVSSILL